MKKTNLNHLYKAIKFQRAQLAELAQWLPGYEKLKEETTVYSHWTLEDEENYKKDIALQTETIKRMLEKDIAAYKAAGGKRAVD